MCRTCNEKWHCIKKQDINLTQDFVNYNACVFIMRCMKITCAWFSHISYPIIMLYSCIAYICVRMMVATGMGWSPPSPPYCNFNVLRGVSLTHSLTHSLTVCVPVCVHVSPCLFVCVLFVRGCARNSHHQISELLPADSCPHTTARSSTTAPSSRAAGSCRPTFRGIIRGKPYVITAWLHLCNIFCQ